MRTVGYVLTGILVAAVLIFAGWGLRWVTAPIEGAVGAQERIESVESRIPRYEYFFDLCAAIQQHEAAIEAQRARLETVTDDTEAGRVRGAIAALETRRAGDIARYNNDARTYTSGRFLDSQLPHQLDTRSTTTCR